MNAHLRRTFYLFVAGFVSLVGVLAYWQVYAKESLATDPANSLQSRRAQDVPRGLILAGDGKTELVFWNQNDHKLLIARPPGHVAIRGGSMRGIAIPRVTPGLPSELIH